MECQILFSGKNKKNTIIFFLSVELAKRVVKVNFSVVKTCLVRKDKDYEWVNFYLTYSIFHEYVYNNNLKY